MTGMLHVTCPKCGSGFDVDDNLKGTKAQCGKCGVCFVVTENGGATLLLPSILPDSGVQGATTNATVTAGPSAPAQSEYGATSDPSSTIGETDLDQHSSATGEEPLPNSLLSEPAPDACGDTFTEESIDLIEITSDCTRIEIYRTVYFITYFSGVVCLFCKLFSEQFAKYWVYAMVFGTMLFIPFSCTGILYSIQKKMGLGIASEIFYWFCSLGVNMFLLGVENGLRSRGSVDFLPPLFFCFLASGLFMNFVHSQLKKVLKYKGDVEVTFFGVVKPCKKDS